MATTCRAFREVARRERVGRDVASEIFVFLAEEYRASTVRVMSLVHQTFEEELLWDMLRARAGATGALPAQATLRLRVTFSRGGCHGVVWMDFVQVPRLLPDPMSDLLPHPLPYFLQGFHERLGTFAQTCVPPCAVGGALQWDTDVLRLVVWDVRARQLCETPYFLLGETTDGGLSGDLSERMEPVLYGRLVLGDLIMILVEAWASTLLEKEA